MGQLHKLRDGSACYRVWLRLRWASRGYLGIDFSTRSKLRFRSLGTNEGTAKSGNQSEVLNRTTGYPVALDFHAPRISLYDTCHASRLVLPNAAGQPEGGLRPGSPGERG